MADEVLDTVDALYRMKVSECLTYHVSSTKYNVPGCIPVNAHLVKGSTYEGALNDFSLIDG
jgi:hypothetical protein